jgi:hypothetical protein
MRKSMPNSTDSIAVGYLSFTDHFYLNSMSAISYVASEWAGEADLAEPPCAEKAFRTKAN